jgi:hypothetical protein
MLHNLKVIDQRNVEDTGAVHGITRFSDLTQAEFESTFLMPLGRAKSGAPVNTTIKPLGLGEQAQQDWTGRYTTPVKDQGAAGLEAHAQYLQHLAPFVCCGRPMRLVLGVLCDRTDRIGRHAHHRLLGQAFAPADQLLRHAGRRLQRGEH